MYEDMTHKVYPIIKNHVKTFEMYVAISNSLIASAIQSTVKSLIYDTP